MSGPHGWSLFPPALSTLSNPAPEDISNMFQIPTRLSPIPQSDDLESDYGGAEVIDTPLRSRAIPSPWKGKHPMSSFENLHLPETHNLSTLVEDTHPEPLQLPLRPPGMTQNPERPTSKKGIQMEHHDFPYPEFRKMHRAIPSSLETPSTVDTRSVSGESFQTNATSLPPLQHRGVDDQDQLEPLNQEDIDPRSFDLIAPPEEISKQYSLEARSELLFSNEHLQIIFHDPNLLLRFTAFLSTNRLSSIPILVYYLESIKALKAIDYSNTVAEALKIIPGFDFTATTANKTVNADLEAKSRQAFDVMVREDLPAYITHIYIQTVSLSIQRRITGTLPSHLREASEGLAEVFCLTDPSRPDNPIVFASQEFHRTTQYGMSYVLGRNCRFLQGPKTNPFSVRRIREKIEAGQEHSEVFLNYRRDGSPFMNLLMCAPLCDSRGIIRYFIGAQVDVSGLVKECSDLESLRNLVIKNGLAASEDDMALKNRGNVPVKKEFQELSEMLNPQELDIVRKWGGRMHKEVQEDSTDSNYNVGNWPKNRLLITSSSPDDSKDWATHGRPKSGRLSGVYEHYLLVRPYPSLRILFASPSLRVPGILQSPFMAKIGGSNRVREELTQALADGRGVTAKVRWVSSKNDTEGRSRWIHSTPLIGSNGAIGVWMIVVVDDDTGSSKKFKMAPPVDPKFGRTVQVTHKDENSLRDFGRPHTGKEPDEIFRRGSLQSHNESERSASPYSLRIE